MNAESKSLASLYILIPVLNEEKNLTRLFSDLIQLSNQIKKEFILKVILIDDGSTDSTSKTAEHLAKEMSLNIIKHPTNLGPGKAFASGFSYIKNLLRENDWVVTIEGDNTSRTETLLQMIHRKNEGFDVVLASPYAYGGGIQNTSFIRVFLSHVANSFVKEFLGIHGILTMSSFFRLYSAKIILKLQDAYGPSIVESNGFECMIELLAKLIKQKASISEVAMTLDGSRRIGKSKMKIIKTILGYLRLFKRSKNWK